MAVAAAKRQAPRAGQRDSQFQEMSWNEIQRPGCYLILGSGELVRVPLITIRVAKLSDNPTEPISALRAVAADNDCDIKF